ncbi:alpha-L-arabinofuranosidase II precursor [Lachnospiraceae bacterium KM106-2]|nr:alpha-L-arabinofuranosidase II precursor [Lachnospiraceae bacterium KM106-2]
MKRLHILLISMFAGMILVFGQGKSAMAETYTNGDQVEFEYSKTEDLIIITRITKVPSSFSGTLTIGNVIAGKQTAIGENFIANSEAVFDKAKLKKLVIGDDVIRISKCAFKECTNLREVSLGSTTRFINGDAFEKTLSLQRIEVASGNSEYESKDGLLLSDQGKTLFIVPCCYQKETFTIPEGVDQLAEGCMKYNQTIQSLNISNHITEIPENMCSESKVQRVTLSDSVKSIGGGAFYEASNLSKVRLSKNLTEIPKSCFWGCNLTEIKFPKGLAKIDEYAFYGNNQLNNVVIPSSVQTIKREAFYRYHSENIDKMVQILNPKAEVDETAFDEYWFVSCFKNSNYYQQSQYTYNGESGIGQPYQNITPFYMSMKYQQKSCGLGESMNIPVITNIRDQLSYQSSNPAVIAIENGAMIPKQEGTSQIEVSYSVNGYTLKSMRNVSYQNGVVRIEDGKNEMTTPNMSQGSSRVKAKISGKTVTDQGIVYQVNTGNENTVTACYLANQSAINSEGNLSFPETIKDGDVTYKVSSIADYFMDQSESVNPGVRNSVKKVVISNKIQRVGAYAFNHCENLSELSLGEHYLTLADYAFGNTALEKVVLPYQLEQCTSTTFGGCSKLKSFGMVSTSRYTAYQCKEGILYDYHEESNVSIVAVPARIEKESYTIPDDVKSANKGFMRGNKTIKTIQFGKNMRSTGISGCRDSVVEEVILPEGITEIDDQSFLDCIYLKKISLPESLNRIGNCGLADTSLEQLILPNALKTLGDYGLEGCHLLEALTIPAQVESIGAGCFYRDRMNLYMTGKQTSFYDTWNTVDKQCKIIGLPGSVAVSYARNNYEDENFNSFQHKYEDYYVKFAQSEISMQQGQESTFSYTTNVPMQITFQSENQSVATVDQNKVHANGAGTTMIQATAQIPQGNNIVVGTMVVTVTKQEESGSSNLAPLSTTPTPTAFSTTNKSTSVKPVLLLKKSTLYINRNHKQKIGIKKNTTKQKLVYKSSNKKIATVSSKGVITAKKQGTVRITVRTKNGSIKKKVKVIIKELSIKKAKVTLKKGKHYKIAIKKNTTKQKLSYRSSNKKIATVTKKGVVTGKKAGKITITISSKDKRYVTSCKVTIKKK